MDTQNRPASNRLVHRGLLVITMLAFSAQALAANGPVPIAVVDFTSSSSTSYRKSLPEMVVNELVNSGEFDVLEREKLDSIVGEIGFQNASGFVSPEQAVQVGGMSGAKLIVTGHVLDHGQERQTYRGYGISTTKTTFRLKARMEVIDVTSGSKLFSNVSEATTEKQTIQGQSYDSTQKGLAESVAKKLVAAMLKSNRIRNLVDGPAPVAVTINSEPADADVEVDGTYYGTANQAIDLVPGIHEITVSLPGYMPWKKRVMVKEGTKVIARLRKDDTIRTETRVELEVEGN